MLAEGLVVHEEVHHLAHRIVRGDPAGELVGRQRPFVPAAVRETEGDVVRQLVVAQQHVQFLIQCVGIDVVGRFPAQHVFGAFGQDGLEPHLGDRFADLVGVDQLRVSEGRGFHPELLAHEGRMEFHLLLEILLRAE